MLLQKSTKRNKRQVQRSLMKSDRGELRPRRKSKEFGLRRKRSN
jgi:hypothetical protein